MINKRTQRWDVFCNIVDNFGDIGVCWRLSQQLVNEHQISVRLFIDDFDIASKIIPNLVLSKPTQMIKGVEICPWPTTEVTLPHVVIENFSCKLPDVYREQVAKYSKDNTKNIVWINLEYLSAEKWVEGCHTLPSVDPNFGDKRYFFFPGFNENTGGLLREMQLIDERCAFLATPEAQNNFWIDHIQAARHTQFDQSIKISLFSYPEADIESLISHLSTAKQSTSLFLPFNIEVTSLKQLISKHQLTLKHSVAIGNTTLYLVPFLSQAHYDKLLWSCDLNFVRGEDSWIRAIWSGKPFIWQPYIQTENTHIEKLNAFLTNYLGTTPKTDPVLNTIHQAHHIWSNAVARPAPDFWQSLLETLPSWQAYCINKSLHYAKQTDLCTQLVTFSNSLKLE